MMDDVYRLRSALSDILEWASNNVRQKVSHSTWNKIRTKIVEIKALIDDDSNHEELDIDTIIDRLTMEEHE
jgi:hypothetical protein